jgi:TonB family protein
MLEVLFASRGVRTPRPVAGAIISTAIHAVVVLAMIVGPHWSAHRSAQLRLDERARRLEEALLKPQFIIPPNRGALPSLEQIRYLAIGAGTETYGVANSRKKFNKHGDFGMPELAGARAVPAVPTLKVPESVLPDNAYSVLDVDSAAVRDPDSAAPAYPPVMMLKGIEGHATMRFVIDSTGIIDLSTVALLEASHAEFVQAVREAMPKMRFHPAKMGLQAVRQLAEQLFKFELKKVASSESAAASKKKP